MSSLHIEYGGYLTGLSALSTHNQGYEKYLKHSIKTSLNPFMITVGINLVPPMDACHFTTYRFYNIVKLYTITLFACKACGLASYAVTL